MPPVNADQLLRPLPPPDLQPRQVHVVCNFGVHDFVYTMCIRELARLLNLKFIQQAPPPTHWAIFRTKCGPMLETIPMDEHYSPSAFRGRGLICVYETAGRYHNGMDAEQELRGLPKRGGKKSAVVIRADVEPQEEDETMDSTDTEYDTDGEPKPKAPKPPPTLKKKPKRKRVVRQPHPQNMEYRDAVVRTQSQSTTEVFTLNGLGDELCTVFAQLLRCFELAGSWKGAFAHLYTNRGWLESVGVQALDAGNDAIAVAAVNILTQLDGGLSK